MSTLRALFLLTCLLMVGCSSTKKIDIESLGPPPAASDLIRLHNQRVAPLDRVWARVSVRAEGRDPQGDKFRDQGEGHLQITRPDRFSLTIGKFEETYFALGANAEEYWSIDLSQKENRVAMIGQQSLATHEKLDALGIPIHPHEMITLVGILPIDESLDPVSRWSPDGKAVGFEFPAQWGSVAIWFDAKTHEVARTQAFNDAGELVASAKLWRYAQVANLEDNARASFPGVIEVRAAGFDGFIRIEVSGPRDKAIRPIVFRPNSLVKNYRVHETIDLDEVFDRTEP